MFKTKKNKRLALSLLSCLLFSQGVWANEITIRIYAASSLTNVLNQLIDQYEQVHDIDIVPIYGGSSSLARQIERGAPADLFISANERWVDHLVKVGIADTQDIRTFTHNQLVVISPVASTPELDISQTQSWLAALNGSRLAIGQPNAVPAGIYAKQSFESLGMWKEISRHLAPTSNVRIALTLVERSEAPLGIVYQSDAMASKKVHVIHTFSDTLHEPIRYPLVNLTNSAGGTDFGQYLMSDAAQKALMSFGFN